MQLYFQAFPDLQSPPPWESTEVVPLVILPGLFGSTANWRGVAQKLGQSATLGGAPVLVLDHRNHGRSPHADSHSYADMVGDLLEFCDEHGIVRINLCGHSMGGKVAMLFALAHPTRVNRLMVMDIAPVAYQHSHAPYLEALLQVDLAQLRSRAEADRQLREAIPDMATRMFLLQSLTGSPGKYAWRINAQVLLRDMPQIIDFPPVTGSWGGATLMIVGGASEYVLPEHHAKIQQLFPAAEFASVPEAGHWVHAEQPQAVIELIEDFIKYD